MHLTKKVSPIISLVFSVILSLPTFSQNNFDITLFGQSNDIPYDCLELEDKSILVVGQHFGELYDSQNKAASLVKLNAKGEVLWEKQFGYHKDDRFHQIIRKDNHIFILGTTTDIEYPDEKIWLIKVNTEGEILAEQKLGNAAEGKKMVLTEENKLIVAGKTRWMDESRKYNEVALHLFMLDLNLDLKWNTIIENENRLHSLDNLEAKNQRIYLTGKVLIDENYQLFVKTIDQNGVELKHTVLQTSDTDGYVTSSCSDDKLIVNTNHKQNHKMISFYTLDLTTDAVISKELIFKRNICIKDFIICPNGNYLVVGYAWGEAAGTFTATLNSDLTLIAENYAECYPKSCEFNSCYQLMDGGVLLSGFSNAKSKSVFGNQWLLKKVVFQ